MGPSLPPLPPLLSTALPAISFFRSPLLLLVLSIILVILLTFSFYSLPFLSAPLSSSSRFLSLPPLLPFPSFSAFLPLPSSHVSLLSFTPPAHPPPPYPSPHSLLSLTSPFLPPPLTPPPPTRPYLTFHPPPLLPLSSLPSSHLFFRSPPFHPSPTSSATRPYSTAPPPSILVSCHPPYPFPRCQP